MKTISGINKKIGEGSAVVITATEFKRLVRDGEILSVDEVDVVTCGTCGVMSGTFAVMTVPVTEPGIFRKAESVSLNGVPAYPGPCPNEGLGLVDIIVYGTACGNSCYGGGNLFRDIVEGKEIEILVSSEGKIYQNSIFGEEIASARMITSRSAFRNYSAIVNPGSDGINTIFSVLPLVGNFKETTVSGCGEINPLQNDPKMRFINTGARVLLNGAIGMVMGEGTRSKPEKPNLAVFADMRDMKPEFMGGFTTSAGPECITSIAAAIPVLDKETIGQLSVLDENISLPVVGVTDRKPVGESDYGRVWQGTDHRVVTNPLNCLFCGECQAAAHCPTKAIMMGGGVIESRCMSCGTCVRTCPGEVYSMEMGSVVLDGREIPVVLRQSDRNRGEMISASFKSMIEMGFSPF